MLPFTLLVVPLDARAGSWTTGAVEAHSGPPETLSYVTETLSAGYTTELRLTYGLWNSPSVTIEVYFDTLLVGELLADPSVSYVSAPGYASWDITALVSQDGAHDIDIVSIDASASPYYTTFGEIVIGEITIVWDSDDDADGFGALSDCDDTDDTIFPDADERCDGKDNDCDGITDSPDPIDPVALYLDEDEDGYGFVEQLACPGTPYTAALPGDCNDTDPTIHPEATEDCAAVDRDCDGSPDAGATDLISWSLDSDADGWGGIGDPVASCAPPEGHGLLGDCDDADDSVHPEADERCNGIDEDCNELIDDNPIDWLEWFSDIDGDGFGGAFSQLACASPGEVSVAGDCDDEDQSIYPLAIEICDGKDNDCDDDIDDDAVDRTVLFADLDGDGFGDPYNDTLACPGAPAVVDNDLDCDDTDPAIHSDGIEVCDGRDNDCDFRIDADAIDAPNQYVDDDGDGFGDSSRPLHVCDASGAATKPGDCDDTDSTLYPHAPGLGGEDGCEPLRKGCGCDITPSAAPMSAILLLSTWLRRFPRRAQEPARAPPSPRSSGAEARGAIFDAATRRS